MAEEAMPAALHIARQDVPPYAPETTEELPAEVERLLTPGTEDERAAAWQKFIERYSRLLLGVTGAFAPGYDGAMDRYLFILDELRRDEFARLRRFAADGRGRFSTWLVVVARRLCVDHHRRRYGRTRASGPPPRGQNAARSVRRRLTDLAGDAGALDLVADLAQHDPLETLDQTEIDTALQRALDQLDPGDRLLLRLRYEEDLTAREIAPLLGLPSPFHVYRRVRMVCASLRGRLGRELKGKVSITSPGPKTGPGSGRDTPRTNRR